MDDHGISKWLQSHRKTLLIFGPILVGLFIFIYYLFSGRYVSTDDAYLQAAKVAINAKVAGQVVEIHVKDNQLVHVGDLLFSIDPEPYQIALKAARAHLQQARLQIQALKATQRQWQANVQVAQNNLTYQTTEYKRAKKLAALGIAAGKNLDQAKIAYLNAQRQLKAAQAQHANILLSLGGNADIELEDHPLVQEATASLKQAELNLANTKVYAPIEGIISKVSLLQVGDYINIGAPVFSLFSTQDIWVEANFRETDIEHMQANQRASIEIDAYPGTSFTGHVASLSPGTGAAFSLLPPENATGNWVKVVQRIPVRIALDQPVLANRLHMGLSVNVSVDTKS